MECALLSLQRYLWNWSAWDLLSSLINDSEEVGFWSCYSVQSYLSFVIAIFSTPSIAHILNPPACSSLPNTHPQHAPPTFGK